MMVDAARSENVPDATQFLFTYRECARMLWNNFLRLGVEPYVNYDAVDAFSGICERLFEEMVLQNLRMSGFKRTSDADPYPFLVLKPRADPAPVMVHRSSEQGRYWDEPINRLAVSGLAMQFIGFYDWDDFGYIDLQYYRVRTARCEEHPHLVGREALVDVHHAGVEFMQSTT
jgi:hypothetical protein